MENSNKRPKWQKILFRTLKEHGVFKEYERELTKSISVSLNKFLNTTNKEGAISSAFLWNKSNLGDKFWHDIHCEYLKKLDEALI